MELGSAHGGRAGGDDEDHGDDDGDALHTRQ
jgi:hypothetical protein